MARVLIIEDEPDVRELYRLVLEDAGHEIVGGFDEPELALSKVGGLEPGPDVIILDERVVGASGTAALPALRKAFPRAKILLATADPDAAANALSEGADAAREKPFPVRQLADIVRDLAGD